MADCRVSQTPAKVHHPERARPGAKLGKEDTGVTRDMTITVSCDTRGCTEEISIDLDSGSLFDDYETRIEKAIEKAGWYINADGEYCKTHAKKSREYWLGVGIK